MAKPIWFPFYPNDFLGSPKVALMAPEEIGVYILLLSYAWQDPTCSLPADDDSLKKLGRFSGDIRNVKACFIVKRGRLVNERLYSEWKKANHNQEMARQSAKKRWDAKAMPTHMPSQCSSPSPSPSPSPSQSSSSSSSPSEKTLKISRAVRKPTRASKVEAKSTRSWEAYREAYKSRYHVDPIRNARMSSLLSQLVDRLGYEAPDVAAFYLTHNAPYYTSKMHAVNLLLIDAEKLRTEWATNTKLTTGAVKNAEARDEAREQINRVEAMLKGGAL